METRECIALVILSLVLTTFFSNLGYAIAYHDNRKRKYLIINIVHFVLGILFALFYPFGI